MSVMVQGNAKASKMCVFCKHWNDPGNTAISPKAPAIGVWLYDRDAKNKCIKNGLNMPARASCSKYECKL